LPGQGVRRRGGDVAAGHAVLAPGRRIGRIDRWAAGLTGLQRIALRRPRLRLVEIPGPAGPAAALIAELAVAAGAALSRVAARARDAASVAAVVDVRDCDLLVTIGGSGVGRSDATIAALTACGATVSHGLALLPGRTAAVGRIGKIPVIALPGTLVLPVLDRLSARVRRPAGTRPLVRKIASSAGLAEVVLLEEQSGRWLPLAVGEWSIEWTVRADAWLVVPAGSEGFAAGTPVHAYLIRDLE
jgi:molybdopterin biosynthesis enzyme